MTDTHARTIMATAAQMLTELGEDPAAVLGDILAGQPRRRVSLDGLPHRINEEGRLQALLAAMLDVPAMRRMAQQDGLARHIHFSQAASWVARDTADAYVRRGMGSSIVDWLCGAHPEHAERIRAYMRGDA
jgi:hypothetical protein